MMPTHQQLRAAIGASRGRVVGMEDALHDERQRRPGPDLVERRPREALGPLVGDAAVAIVPRSVDRVDMRQRRQRESGR